MELTTLDFVFIGIYFILLIIIGIIVNRKETNEDFLISSRNLNLISGISTINASKTGSILMVYTGLVFVFGISAIWYFIGTLLGYLIFIPFSIKLFKQSKNKHYTLAEYFYQNYSKTTGNLSNILTLIIMIGFLVINLTAAANVFEFFTNISFSLSSILIIIIILMYILLGGFKAVIKTDIIQYISILGILILIPIALINSGTQISNINFNLLEAGIGSLIGFLLLGFLFPFASPELWQRVYAMSDIKTLKKSILYSSIFYLIFGLLLTYVALLIKSIYPNLDPSLAFVSGLSQMLPVGLIGLIVVLLISAFMSSIDTYLYTASSAFVQNFMRNKNKNRIKFQIRYVMIIIASFGTLITLFISNLVNSTFLTTFVIVLSIPIILTWINPKTNEITLRFGFIMGMLTIFILLPFEFMKTVTDPSIVIKGIMATIFGLIIGAIYVKIKY